MSDPAKPPKAESTLTRSQEEFQKASDPVKALIRQVLRDEREVAHMKRRPNIHQTILEHVKQIIP